MQIPENVKRVSILFLIIQLFSAGALIAQHPWKLRKEKDGIKVFFRQAEDSNLKELKIHTRMQGSLGAAVAFISDIDNFPNWMDHCREVKYIDKRSVSNYTYYNLADFPWPLSDREFVMRCTSWQDPTSLACYFQSVADPKAIPLNKNYVRVQLTVSQWKIEPDGPGYIKLEYYLKADPGGAIPAWMVNAALDNGPVKAMLALRYAVQHEPYAARKLSYVKEP